MARSPAQDLKRLQWEPAVGGFPGLRAYLESEGMAPPQVLEPLQWFNNQSLGGLWTADELQALTKGYEELVRLRPEADPAFQQEVHIEYERALVREHARARRDAEREPPPELPPVGWTLRDALGDERPPLEWAVNDLHVAGGNTLIVASYKAGKTTLALNLVKALVDREAFLDVFPTDLPRQRAGRLPELRGRRAAVPRLVRPAWDQEASGHCAPTPAPSQAWGNRGRPVKALGRPHTAFLRSTCRVL